MKLRSAALAVLVILGSGTACSNTPSASNTAEPSVAAAATPATAATPAPSASAAAASSTPEVAACRTSDMIAKLGNPSGAAGTTYETLTLTNGNPVACTISGYAVVSLVDANGTQVGALADRDPTVTPKAITLGHLQSVYAAVAFPNPGNFPSGRCLSGVAKMRVAPPGNTEPLFVATTHDYCPGFRVQAFSETAP